MACSLAVGTRIRKKFLELKLKLLTFSSHEMPLVIVVWSVAAWHMTNWLSIAYRPIAGASCAQWYPLIYTRIKYFSVENRARCNTAICNGTSFICTYLCFFFGSNESSEYEKILIIIFGCAWNCKHADNSFIHIHFVLSDQCVGSVGFSSLGRCTHVRSFVFHVEMRDNRRVSHQHAHTHTRQCARCNTQGGINWHVQRTAECESAYECCAIACAFPLSTAACMPRAIAPSNNEGKWVNRSTTKYQQNNKWITLRNTIDVKGPACVPPMQVEVKFCLVNSRLSLFVIFWSWSFYNL